jgi:hypothetical protein
MEKGRNPYSILARKQDEERLLGRYRHSWKNNIKKNLER